MLLVGRQLGICDKAVVCRQCTWEDLGYKLSTKLVWLEWMSGYICVYCCPVCASPDLAYKGKVLPFRSRFATEPELPHNQIEESDRERNKAEK